MLILYNKALVTCTYMGKNKHLLIERKLHLDMWYGWMWLLFNQKKSGPHPNVHYI